MSSSDVQGIMAALLGIVVLTFVVGGGYYVWYGLVLARLFPDLGGEGWKGWVPILNEAEILARGGVPAWSVVFYFIPVLQLYGLYLKAMAVQRINLQFGRGVGLAILGILLPPAWATVLVASHRGDTGEFERRVASIMPTTRPDQATGPVAETAPPFPTQVTDASGYAVFSTYPSQPPASPSVSAELLTPPAPVPTAAPSVESTVIPPVAPARTKSALAESVRPIMEFPRIIPLPGARREPVKETVVVDRRQRVVWSLVLDDGRTFPLSASDVALGRNPSSAAVAAQLLPIPDTTRTLSKTHARLTLDDGRWTITDLGSTNGVLVVGADDAETLIEPSMPTILAGRFILGEVGMRIDYEQPTLS